MSMRAIGSLCLVAALATTANAKPAKAPLGCWQLSDTEQVTVTAKGGSYTATDRFATGHYQSEVTLRSDGKWEFDCRRPSIHGQFCLAEFTGGESLEVVVYARSYRDQRQGKAAQHIVAPRCKR